eukprot:94781_1
MSQSEDFCFDWSFLDAFDIVLLVASLFVGCYVSYKGKKGLFVQSVRKLTKVSYIVMVVSYFCASIGFFLALVFDHHFRTYRFSVADELEEARYDRSPLSLVRYAITDMAFLSYFVILMLLLFMIITRLIATFKENAKVFYLITLLAAITLIIGFGLTGHSPLVGGLLITVAGLFYLIASAVMIVLFVKKLHVTILNMQDAIDEDEDALELNEVQTMLVNSTTKYVILSSIGLVSTLFVIVMNFVFRLAWHCVLYRIWLLWVLKLDVMINMICFYLQFSFSSHDYQRLCVRLDKYVKRNMENKVLIGMKNMIQNGTGEEQETVIKEDIEVTDI